MESNLSFSPLLCVIRIQPGEVQIWRTMKDLDSALAIASSSCLWTSLLLKAIQNETLYKLEQEVCLTQALSECEREIRKAFVGTDVPPLSLLEPQKQCAGLLTVWLQLWWRRGGRWRHRPWIQRKHPLMAFLRPASGLLEQAKMDWLCCCVFYNSNS